MPKVTFNDIKNAEWKSEDGELTFEANNKTEYLLDFAHIGELAKLVADEHNSAVRMRKTIAEAQEEDEEDDKEYVPGPPKPGIVDDDGRSDLVSETEFVRASDIDTPSIVVDQ